MRTASWMWPTLLMAASGCYAATPSEGDAGQPEDTAEACSNGLDDDLDGAVDCADADCFAKSPCIPVDAGAPDVDAGRPPDGGACGALGADCDGAPCCAGLVCASGVCAGDADGGAAVSCGAGESRFPSFERGCATRDDCVVVEHQINCCGTLRALGIAATEGEAFAAAEASCREMYPGCGCASEITEADDGTRADGTRAARVECVGGICRSSFGLEDGAVCDPAAAACGAGSSCCYPCGIPDCDYRCEPSCEPGSSGCADGCLLRP